MVGEASEVARAIANVAKAYVAGEEDFVTSYLHPRVHVLGSEADESWRGHYDTEAGLHEELADLRAKRRTVGGELVEAALEPPEADIKVRGDVAWWSYTGKINLHGESEEQSSWSVVLERNHGGEWKVVHSHFSVHRPA